MALNRMSSQRNLFENSSGGQQFGQGGRGFGNGCGGHGERGQGRENGRGGRNNNRNFNDHNENGELNLKGDIEELGSHVFIFGSRNQVDTHAETTKAIGECCERTLKSHERDIHEAIDSLKKPAATKARKPMSAHLFTDDDAAKKMKKEEHKDKFGEWSKRTEA